MNLALVLHYLLRHNGGWVVTRTMSGRAVAVRIRVTGCLCCDSDPLTGTT